MREFSSLEGRGWEIAPVYQASRDNQIFRGTAEEIREQISAFEHQQAEAAKRRIREQEERERLDKLVNRVYALLAERFEAWNRYKASDDHRAKMEALKRSAAVI